MEKKMIKVDKPINLIQLDKELNSKGLISKLENDKVVSVGLADENDSTIDDLIIAIEKHKAIDELSLIQEQRRHILEKLGITEEEAKLLLG